MLTRGVALLGLVVCGAISCTCAEAGLHATLLIACVVPVLYIEAAFGTAELTANDVPAVLFVLAAACATACINARLAATAATVGDDMPDATKK